MSSRSSLIIRLIVVEKTKTKKDSIKGTANELEDCLLIEAYAFLNEINADFNFPIYSSSI